MQSNWQRIKDQPELLKQFLVREQVIDGIREFFKAQGFHEVETPLLVKYPGTEPFLEVFETKLKLADGRQEQAFLLTSPEFAMKKLLAAGMNKIFQITKSFRNSEGLSPRHNPEFTILEWYRTESDYQQIMTDCEQLLRFLVKSDTLSYQGKNYDLSPSWPRISVAEAFAKWVGLDADQLLNREQVVARAKEEGYQVDENTTWEEAYNQLFLNLIEPQLSQMNRPVIIYDYPLSQAAYSRPKQEDPRFAERFEFYLAGMELGNAFSELLDADQQQAKFEEDLNLRNQLGKTPYGMDQNYLAALKSGIPAAGGIAVGVDRLVMLLADTTELKDVTFFPAPEVFELA